MLKGLFVGILALLLISTHSQSNTAKFVFSWYQGHCQYEAQQGHGDCDPDKVALWDHQSFTIHGLWPDSKTRTKYGNFDASIIERDAQLLDDMQNYWPPQSKAKGSNTFLWKHEWDNHGHDYSALIYRIQPSRFAGLSGRGLNSALQSAFYHDVIAFYKEYTAAKRYPSSELTKQSLAQTFGVTPNQITVSCVPESSHLRQFKLCIEITANDVKPKACTNQANFQCDSNNFELPEWSDQIQQERVVAYGSGDADM